MDTNNDKFFGRGGEMKSACATNFNTFQNIQLKRSTAKSKNTAFTNGVIRAVREKKVNPEIARLKALCQARRDKYKNAAENYDTLLKNASAKVKVKDGVRFIEKREKGRFAGKIELKG